MFEKFCHQCSVQIPEETSYPFHCDCGFALYSNPRPVVVAVTPIISERQSLSKYAYPPFSKQKPVKDAQGVPQTVLGYLGVQRAIKPLGLAFPGGFLETSEDVIGGLKRELWEETSLVLESKTFIPLSVNSVADNLNLLIFFQTDPIPLSLFKTLKANDRETEDVVMIDKHNYNEIIFPTHKQVASQLF